ncbi:MAG TPA: hypothetical protein VFS43_38450 [Polyangiaceae bacterium]|nr:hypothetical protein [Polyangiaceae bacterium]
MPDTSPDAAPAPANLDPGVPPMPQEFLRSCEAVAGEEAAKFFTAYAVGAKVTALNETTSYAHVVVRAREPNFAGYDVETAVDCTEGMALHEMRAAWQQQLQQQVALLGGLAKVVTEPPQSPPPSDVEPGGGA